MARDGLVERRVIEWGPPMNVQYELTPLGLELAKPASELVRWVDNKMPEVEASRELYRVKQVMAASDEVD